MFTGIVEEVGELKRKYSSSSKYQLEITANKVLNNLEIGHSIAVNGVCLTAVDFTGTKFTADVMPGTLEATNLRLLKRGSKVNLERAVRADSFMGGHLVTGHVDDTAKVINIREENNAKLVELDIASDLMKFMINKGSIALNGVSLTIYKVKTNSVLVSLIPETWEATNLKFLEKGSNINVEADIIGKYVAKMMGAYNEDNSDNKSKINKDFLKNNGFI